MYNFELKGSKASVKEEAVKRLTNEKLVPNAAFVAAQIDSLPTDISTIHLVVTTRGKHDREACSHVWNMQVRIDKIDILS